MITWQCCNSLADVWRYTAAPQVHGLLLCAVVAVLSPGMMLTELLLEGATVANKQAFNILCEHPETVAAFLVPRVRSAVSCGLNGTYTRWVAADSELQGLDWLHGASWCCCCWCGFKSQQLHVWWWWWCNQQA